MKTIFLLFFVNLLISQDSLNVFEQARMHEDNMLNQLTRKSSKLRFISIRNHEEFVQGRLIIDKKSYTIVNGILNLAESEIKTKASVFEAFFTSPNYIDKRVLIYHAFGAVDNPIFYVLDKRFPKKVQIVLNWDNRSRRYDLDSHLKSKRTHVYYRNKSSYSDGARIQLNRDVRRGNAYELIVIDKPSKNDDYYYFVQKYRGDSGWTQKNVHVDVFFDNKFQNHFTLRNAMRQNLKNWLVFKLDFEGSLQYVNQKN